MKFEEESLELFGTTNLYEIFKVKTKATPAQIKKAYYQISILCHPDRFATANEEQKIIATRKFQLIGKIYSILSDEEKRAVYDDTGITDEEDEQNLDWYKFWKKTFKKITSEDIEAYLKKFRGSDEEMKSLRDAYLKYKGNMNKIMETVIGADVSSEDRYREIIDYYIKNDGLIDYTKFTKEPMSSRIKRLNKARREAAEASKYVEEIKLKKAKFDTQDDLVAAIQAKNSSRNEELIANLENKYCKKPKTKKKK